MISRPGHVVAIPARDEAEHIGPCLHALAGQAQRVVLLVNNSGDGTATVAAEVSRACNLDVTIVERTFGPAECSAGHARRLAVDLAAAMFPGAVMMTTDADSRVAPDWIAANLRALAAGADAVAGRAVIDPHDAAAIPDRLHEDDARECALGALLDEIASLLDPDPADPWPRHTEHSGASICVTADALARAGGIPDVSLGEDRGFFAALRQVDAVIRHAPDVHVTVSGRTLGRAAGGMADTIRRRLAGPDPLLDDALEPVAVAVRRARLRAWARRAWAMPGCGGGTVAREFGLSERGLQMALSHRYFGAAWAGLEARCPALRRVAVPAAMVETEMALARRVLATLRVRPVPRRDPSDRSRPGDGPGGSALAQPLQTA